MRVLHVVPTYLPARRYGGPIFAVHALCSALARRGSEVHVYTTNVDGRGESDVPLDSEVEIDGVWVRYFPSRYGRRIYFSPPLRKRIRKGIHTFDLVHLHSIFLWPTWAAAREARGAGVPWVISPRGMLVKDLVRRKSTVAKSLWLGLVEKNNLENAAVLHVTSTIEAREAGRFGFDLPPLHVVPNGFNPDQHQGGSVNSVRIMDSLPQPYLLFLGRVNWKKGLDRLVSALGQVEGLPLVVAGNDEENYRKVLEAQAEREGVADRVRFVGPVYGSEKERLLAGAALLLLPSYSENFGNVVLEAMASGTPVVVTPEVGAADIVRAEGAGVVTEGRPEEIAAAIRLLLADPEGLKEMGERGRTAVKERYSWDAAAERMNGVYKRILNGDAGERGRVISGVS